MSPPHPPAQMTLYQTAFLAAFAILIALVAWRAFSPRTKRWDGFHHKPDGDASLISEIKYNPRQNCYKLRGNKLLPVSEAVSLFFEDFDKERYASLKAHKTGKTVEEIIDEWNITQERSKQKGLFLRSEIMRYFTGAPLKQKFRFRYVGKTASADETLDVDKEMRLFAQSVATGGLRPLRVGQLIADLDLRLAGRVAFIGKHGDDYEIIDWKRADGITDAQGTPITVNPYGRKGTNGYDAHDDTPFWRYTLQLNLYRAILERNYHIPIQGITLFDVNPRKTTYTHVAIPLLGDELKTILSHLRTIRV